MNQAKCVEDGIIYSALEFYNLSQVVLDRKRRFLQCEECGGPAFYRGATSKRAACFGARPHADGCKMAAQDYLQSLFRDNEDIDYLNTVGNKIVVDFNYGAHIQQAYADPARYINDQKHVVQGYGKVYRRESIVHRRLSSLLRTLIEAPAFGYSDDIIEVHDHAAVMARDLFIPLLSVNHFHIGLFKCFWGLISDARLSDDKSTIWFNSGRRDNISFCLSTHYLPDFNKRYSVESDDDLAGSYILAFGTASLAKNGKLYCEIVDIDHMALKLT